MQINEFFKTPIWSEQKPEFVKSLNKQVKSIYRNALPLIVPRIEAFDIDTEEDLKIIKKIF